MIGGGMSHRGMFRRKGGAGWSPSDISDLIMWLDAKDSSTITFEGDSGRVKIWADKSSESNNVAQNTFARQPIYTGDSLDFSNNLLANFSVSGFAMTSATFICAFNAESTTGVRMIMVMGTNSGSPSYPFVPILHISSGNLIFSLRNLAGTGNNISTPISISTDYIATCAWDGDGMELFLNGVSKGTLSGADMDFTNTNNHFAIGSRIEGTQQFFEGLIYTSLIYAKELSTVEQGQVEGFINNRYNF